MQQLPNISLSLLLITTLAACGESSAPSAETGPGSATAGPGPWDTLEKIAPEARPYGLDVYTAKCASCHGDLGQGVDGNPALKGISPTAMQQKLLDYRDGRHEGQGAAAKRGLTEAEIAAVAIYAGD